ncbi:hypothetical protein [Amycolatopsis sp. GA6-003]|uniref:hypothetical protein n=1 Tax=Amycolatopsis sp. GA6-003 TaxID=2652444 RepID=UPI003916F0C2
MPELWWSASEKALWEKDDDGYFCPDYYPVKASDELPADAVKLVPAGDPMSYTDKLNEIREVIVEFGQLDKANQTSALETLEKIDVILDRPAAGSVERPCASCLTLGHCQRGDECDVSWTAAAPAEPREDVVALDAYRTVVAALKGKEAALEEIEAALGMKLAAGEPYSRLAEVIRERLADAHGQVVEHRECSCFVTPESLWTKHYDATEPGSMMEPNPECPVHFGQAVEHREDFVEATERALRNKQQLPRPWEVAGTVEHTPEMQAALERLAPIMIPNPNAGKPIPISELGQVVEHQPAADSALPIVERAREFCATQVLIEERDKNAAERDQLQARIGKALAACGGTDDERRIARILRGEEDSRG